MDRSILYTVSSIFKAVHLELTNVKKENDLRGSATQVYGMVGYPEKNLKPVLIIDKEGELSGDELALIRQVLEGAGVTCGEQRDNSGSPILGSALAIGRQVSRFDIDMPRIPDWDERTGQLIFREHNAGDIKALADLVQQNLISRGRGRG